MRQFLSLLSTFLLTLFLANCGGAQVTPNQNGTPSWYTNPPQTTTSKLYGLGQGESRKEAINEALSDALATLSSSVSSEFQNSTTVNNNNGNENYTKSAKAQVAVISKQININNYEVVEYAQAPNRSHIALIEIDKHQLYTHLHQSIENSFNMLSTKLQNISDELEKILIYNKYISRLNTQLSTVDILSTLNPAFDRNSFNTAFKQRIAEYNALLQGKSFNLDSGSVDTIYVHEVRAALLENSIKITPNPDANYRISLKVVEKDSVKIQRETLYKLQTTLSMSFKDLLTNKDVGMSQIVVESESYESPEDARKQNANKLKTAIEESGAFNNEK